MTQTPEEISHDLLNAARKAGADAADAIVIDGTSVSIEVREGALEKILMRDERVLGLRQPLGEDCREPFDRCDSTTEWFTDRAWNQ